MYSETNQMLYSEKHDEVEEQKKRKVTALLNRYFTIRKVDTFCVEISEYSIKEVENYIFLRIGLYNFIDNWGTKWDGIWVLDVDTLYYDYNRNRFCTTCTSIADFRHYSFSEFNLFENYLQYAATKLKALKNDVRKQKIIDFYKP